MLVALMFLGSVVTACIASAVLIFNAQDMSVAEMVGEASSEDASAS